MKNLKFLKLFLPIFLLGLLASCSDDDNAPIEGCTCLTSTNYNSAATIDDGSCIAPPPSVDAPTTYAFVRNCESTVSYSGQTTRLMQADELYSALNNNTYTQEALELMFSGDDNGSSAGFENPDLNETSKIIGSKTSAYANTGTNLALFRGWLAEFANEVAPELQFNPDGTKLDTAEPGMAGYLGGYELNAEGQEIDQLFFKSLIGAFTLDQIINNYITPSQLDATYTDDNDTIDRRENNTNGVLYSDKNYTEMEHKWDEGFGYLYGQVADIESNFGLPVGDEATGNLLMKYFKKVEENYEPGIAETVYNAFIAGRHAITVADYDARDEAATIIKTELSKVIGYYAKHYLNDYIAKVASDDIAKAHHSLSEGYGFIFSLQFTNNGADAPYMENSIVMYALNNYFNNFHTQQSNYITDPNQGMIAQIDDAFGW
tara:strand:- start:1435 stop:2730 length:1296 start_codon:yes stop_codon:yes gene_type:complete